jgi:uncharacterized protein DUF882
MVGQAIDVRTPGRDLRSLRKVAIALIGGGVGYYPKSDFVHIDVDAYAIGDTALARMLMFSQYRISSVSR